MKKDLLQVQMLELKIPPPLVALLVALGMWWLSFLGPMLETPLTIRTPIAIAIALCGGAFDIAGVLTFRSVKTTVNPMKPHSASSLVISGIYKITRNPMYVGLLIILVAWTVFLFSLWALLGPLAFYLYIGRFQITPEEKILLKLFGDQYAAYKTKVPRWL